jgi:hypothetical protein
VVGHGAIHEVTEVHVKICKGHSTHLNEQKRSPSTCFSGIKACSNMGESVSRWAL